MREMIGELVEIQRAMGQEATAARIDSSRKSALVELRQRFGRQVTKITENIDRDPVLGANPVLQKEFRSRLAAMRSQVTTHQAKWPAVLLDNSGEEFGISVDQVVQSNRAFAAWAFSILK